MSSARSDPDPALTVRPRTRKHHRAKPAESEGTLTHLRLRCRGGAAAAFSAYLAVLTTTVVQPSALTLTQIVSLEIGLGVMATLCALVAIVLWLLTQNTNIALSIFKAASAASAANAALESELAGATGTHAPAIPIQRGQELRRHRDGRHAS